MSGTPLWRRYLRFWGEDRAADVGDEFAFHLEMRVEQLVAEGLSPRDAREEALRGFGDLQEVKTICRTLAEEKDSAMRTIQWWADWRHDARFAVRQLTVAPMLTAVVVMTMALGIGSTVAIFSVLNAVLLQPLPFAASERVVFVWETLREFRNGNASVGHFHDWTEQGTVFEHTAVTRRTTYNLADGEPERIIGATVTPGYFRVVQIAPAVGRYFTESDVARDPQLVILSHGLWQRRFGGDLGIVGRAVRLDGVPHTVIGVAPPQYNMTRAMPEAWTPLVFTSEQRANYGAHLYTVMARLKPGVPRDAAQADMERVTRDIAVRQPRQMEGRSVNVEPYGAVLLGNIPARLYVLVASVVIVLLIGCLNVANLLLARVATRRKEIAIRAAIGGGRWRIVRQLLTESVALALVGGIAGLSVAWVGARLFVAFGPANVPRLQDTGLQGEVLLFALAVTLLTGLLFGLAPAFRAAREDLVATLREGGRSSLPAGGGDRLRGMLVVAEIAVAIVLLVGAGLFIRSAWRLQQVPLGFERSGVLSARVALPEERYRSEEAVTDGFRRMLEEVRGAPGVERAGASTAIPLTGGAPTAGIMLQGKTLTPGSAPIPALRLVTEDYVEAIGMRLQRGRTFTAADMAPGAPRTALINEGLANVAWPGENPISKQLSMWDDEPRWYEVIGVVGDVRSAGPDTPAMPELFLPYTIPPFGAVRSMALVVRSAGEPTAHVPVVRRAVRSVDASLPLYDVLTMDEALAAEVAGTRFNTWLLSLLAATGLVLAAVGVYGLIAYFVLQRTSEIGLRLALGAPPRSILLMVLRHGASLALAGVVIGLFAAAAATRVLTTLLFEITATDLLTYVAGALVLFAIALLACTVPAMRAVRISPIRSLAES